MYKRRRVILLMILLLSAVSIFKTTKVQAAVAEKQELKVLVIEINPYLESKGKKVTDFLNTFGTKYSLDTSVQSLKEDFAIGSNGLVNCTIVGTEYLNEFPKYTQKFTLSHLDASGKRVITGKDYRLDEKTYLDMFSKGWHGWWNTSNPVMEEGIDDYPFKFDYNYLLKKFDLVNRRNANEFDMVWVFSIDPVSMGETNMIGRSSFWVNGDTVYADCKNFVMGGFTFSRSDSAFECIGHLAESMLNYVYKVSNEEYNEIIDFKNYNKLSTWQKFYLCLNKASSGFRTYGVGQVHFAPNSTKDYDWENETPVLSTWIDWRNNYPNLTGETAEFTPSLYLKKGVNLNQAHKRWWFSLMPHHLGRDENGYSHNWWDYILSLDFVTKINTYDEFYEKNALDQYRNTILLEKGEVLSGLKFKLNYKSEKSEDFIIDNDYEYISCSNNNVIEIDKGEIKALSTGTALLTLKYDGRKSSYKITVVDDKNACLINYFDKVKVDTSNNVIYQGTANNTTNISITNPNNYSYKATYKSSNPAIATVSSKGKVKAVSKGKTTITTTIAINGQVKKYTTNITVKDSSLKISSFVNNLKVGNSFTFKATTLGLKEKVKWSVNNTKVATINSVTGKLTAIKPGDVYIIANIGDITKKIKVTVTK